MGPTIQRNEYFRELKIRLCKKMDVNELQSKVAELLMGREEFFDQVDIIVEPVLIGGKETYTLIDGSSIVKEAEFDKLGVLSFIGCDVLKNSYIRLRYKVVS